MLVAPEQSADDGAHVGNEGDPGPGLGPACCIEKRHETVQRVFRNVVQPVMVFEEFLHPVAQPLAEVRFMIV